MDLKPFIYRCALALLIGFATFTTINFYRAEKPFFIRLRQKKRVHYKIQKIKKHQSGICAQLAGEKSLLTFRLSFQNDDIIHVQINDSDCTRYVVQDVVTLHSKILDSRDLSMEENNNTLYIECMHFIITIVCDDFEMNIYRNGKQILSVNSQKLLLMEEGEPHVGASADFLFNAAIRAYGLPQHAEKLTLRPTGNKFYRLYNTDRFAYSSADCFQSLYGAVPLVYAHGSDQTTGLLWLNSSETFVGIDYTKIGVNSTFFSESGAIDFYVLSGPTFEDCVKQNSQLTGKFDRKHLSPLIWRSQVEFLCPLCSLWATTSPGSVTCRKRTSWRFQTNSTNTISPWIRCGWTSIVPTTKSTLPGTRQPIRTPPAYSIY
jgi:alpha-glucosidase (family GH31 glycosyl hydrolase)